MAEVLGIVASLITVLDVTQNVLSVCYDYDAALRGASWQATRVKDELEGLRNVLQTLEPLMRQAELSEPVESRLPALDSLCGSQCLLQSCKNEMQTLEKRLKPPGWSKNLGHRRKALVKALQWPLKELETNRILESIERFKSTMSLAHNADLA